MKAVITRKPGRPESLTIEEVAKPELTDDGLLVQVRASSLNPVDFFQLSRAAHLMRLARRERRGRPEIIGSDFAGTVEAVGSRVTRFKPGDEVFGSAKGAYAEYVSVAESAGVARKPAGLTFEHAAAVPVAGLTALQAVRDHGRVEPGKRVLVNGASGGVGTLAVQIAKALGAQVTAVCGPLNADRVRAIGADRVIDYTREDFTRDSEQYDVLIDVAGSKPWSACIRMMKPKAIFVATGASVNTVWGGGGAIRHLAGIRLASLGSSRKAAFFIAKLKQEDLDTLGDLLEARRITPVIDRCYRLEEVAEAMTYLGEGHAKGKIVITL